MQKMKTKIGTIVSLDLPQIDSQLSSLGFDFLFIDLEHGSISDVTISSIIQTRKEDCKIYIRIAEITEAQIKHALDLGCDGIIAPRVESMEEIRILFDYSYYPPKGRRGVGLGLATQYGLRFKEYTTGFKPVILPQVESKKGLEIAGEIAKNEGVSGIFIGPYDLSMSLGVPGEFESDIFKKAYNSIRDVCRENNKLFCSFTSSEEGLKKEIKNGTDLVAYGTDASIILKSYIGIVNSFKSNV
jgi:2-keto-3-deoxy-L-rhamnonate aldolase RhmA